jgi:hypothetical protein
MKRFVLFFCAGLWLTQIHAESDKLLVWSVEKSLDHTYKIVYKYLENNKFFVVFEPDIHANLSGFAERWGAEYNRNKLEGIRAMVFCNGWYTNQVSNADPDMLAMCPLHITLTQRLGVTRVLFVRPSVVASGSKAHRIAKELEEDVSRAIDAAVNELNGCPAAC